MNAAAADMVSFDSEPLIIVDADDRVLGHGSKVALHEGLGTLHRAFSIFLFNSKGEVLLTKRSNEKPLWPGYWSNTCCSHPRRGESYQNATQRRLREELGVETALEFTHRFQYQAHFGDSGSEHELCSVYVGVTDDNPSPHPMEIADWQWLTMEDLDRWIEESPESLTPWCTMEWQELRSGRYRAVFQALGL
jgi:isopentenyl-diphosphate delta-isomerase